MVTNAYLYNGYTVTRNFVKNINACRKCGYRLYAKDDQQVRTGNGNINGNELAAMADTLGADKVQGNEPIYKQRDEDGSSIYDNFYIIYSIRCNTNGQIGFNNDSIRYCAYILHDELCMITNIIDVVFIAILAGISYAIFSKKK